MPNPTHRAEELTMIALALRNQGIEDCTPERGVELLIERLYGQRSNAMPNPTHSDVPEDYWIRLAHEWAARIARGDLTRAEETQISAVLNEVADLLPALRQQGAEQERERMREALLSDGVIDTMLDILGEEGWRTTTYGDISMAEVIGDAREALRTALKAVFVADLAARGLHQWAALDAANGEGE